MHRNKTYVGIMRLHEETSETKLKETIKEFIGKITQTPPVRSRVKRAPREREVKTFEILEINDKDVLFKTEVQAGTYIRKLCLHPNTEVLTRSGLIKIKDITYDKNIYSLNNKEIITKNPSDMQKIASYVPLIKLEMESGIDIITTNDHKMLVSTNEGHKMIECQSLKEGDYLVKANPKYLDKDYTISDFLDDDYLIEQPEIKQLCKKEFIKRFGSIREVNRKLKLDRKVFLRNSKIAISIRHLKLAGIYDVLKSKLYRFKTPKGKILNLNKLTEDHFYLLGLIASDGNNTKEKRTKRFTRLKFHNENEFLIDTFIKIYKKLFPNINISKKKVKQNLFEVDTSNSLFASVAASLGIISPNKSSDISPLLYVNKKCIRSFLKGYFDGDGTAHYKIKTKTKGVYSKIAFFSVNYTNAKRLHQMLLKSGIQSKIFRLKSGMNVVDLSDISSKKKFIREIGSNHPSKRIVLKKIDNMACEEEIGSTCHIGLHYKSFIKKNKSKLYKMGGNLNRILSNNIPITERFYKGCSKFVNLPKLDNLTIEKIRKIKNVKSPEFVFDITVPKTHNFLIETGFISSNCDDMGKKIGGAHMLELRRTQAGIFQEKDSITLYDLEKAIDEYKAGNEEPLRKILIPAEIISQVLPVVQVNPKNLKQILTGKPLFINDIINKEELTNINDNFALFNNNVFIGVYHPVKEKDIIARADFICN